MDVDRLKYLAGKEALELVPSDTDVLAFGAGSTVLAAIDAFYDSGMDIPLVCASKKTADYARDFGILVLDPISLVHRDFIYIDGTDEIDPNWNMLKGAEHGTGNPGLEGCMYKEKTLAYDADTFIVIADASKRVAELSTNFQMACEIRKNYADHAIRFLNSLGLKGQLRTYKGKDFITENECLVYDADIPKGMRTDEKLSVLEDMCQQDMIFSTGLFALRKPDYLVIADAGQVNTYNREDTPILP